MADSDSPPGGPGPRCWKGRWAMLAQAGLLLFVVLGVAGVLMMRPGVSTASRRGEPGRAIELPPPRAEGGMALTEALARRRSCREYAAKPLSLGQVAQLCWAAQGIADEAEGYRTAPSAGALYPITVFVVDGTGAYEYEPGPHVLRPAVVGDLRGDLRAAALQQAWVGAAPLCLVITVDVARTAAKYGSRAERYCLLEAGHVAQNVLLQATALGLAGVPVGAFEDRRVAAALGLPSNLRPVYLVPVGYPRGE